MTCTRNRQTLARRRWAQVGFPGRAFTVATNDQIVSDPRMDILHSIVQLSILENWSHRRFSAVARIIIGHRGTPAHDDRSIHTRPVAMPQNAKERKLLLRCLRRQEEARNLIVISEMEPVQVATAIILECFKKGVLSTQEGLKLLQDFARIDRSGW